MLVYSVQRMAHLKHEEYSDKVAIKVFLLVRIKFGTWRLQLYLAYLG